MEVSLVSRVGCRMGGYLMSFVWEGVRWESYVSEGHVG